MRTHFVIPFLDDIEDIELTCPSNYTAVEYAPHNLSCSVEGQSSESLITWYKDGEEVELPEILTRYDAGQYVVVATSSSSMVNATVDLNVVCESISCLVFSCH